MTERIDVGGADREVGVARAAEALQAAEVVVLPTDTCYGLAADAFALNGTDRLRRVARRERRAPLPVLLRSPKQLNGLASALPRAAELLMAAYWPGPVTLVVTAEPSLAWDLGDAEGTVAVRMPLDPVALAVVRAVGPLAVTSAAWPDTPPPHSVAEAEALLGDEVACYLDDGPRPRVGLSTIVDLTRRQPVVLRAGRVPADEVLAVARGELDPLEVPPLAADPAGDPAGDLHAERTGGSAGAVAPAEHRDADPQAGPDADHDADPRDTGPAAG